MLATPSGGRLRRRAANVAADLTRRMAASEGAPDGPSDGEHIDDSPHQSDAEEQKGKRRSSQSRKNHNTNRKKTKLSNSETTTQRVV
jgi:hypothetical protein